MQELLDVATIAARAAGEFIQSGAQNRSELNIEQKSLHDYVSEIDTGAEKIIREHIERAFPEHAVLGEEYGVSPVCDSNYQWVIDPLDGTTNFIRGIPHYAISIALQHHDEVMVGVVFDPVKNEMFSAVKGQGARLNGDIIKASELEGVPGSLLATGVPFNGESLDRLAMFTDAMTALLQQNTAGIRRLGSAALDLAYVAAGRYDGFWEANLKIWDIAAGALIVQEAGGIVSDFESGARYLQSGHIIASGARLHGQMQQLIEPSYRHW